MNPSECYATTNFLERDFGTGIRPVTTNEPAAPAGENRRTAGETCPVLLVAFGGGSSDAAALWSHAAIASGIGEPLTQRISVTREAGEGKVSGESIREAAVSALAFSGGVELPPLRSLEMPCTENRARALHPEAVRRILPVGREMKTEIPEDDVKGRRISGASSACPDLESVQYRPLLWGDLEANRGEQRSEVSYGLAAPHCGIDPMFNFDQTSVASERNNSLWFPGRPRLLRRVRASVQQSLIDPGNSPET
jgi:hypothetical protein